MNATTRTVASVALLSLPMATTLPAQATDTAVTKASLIGADRELAHAVETRGPNAFLAALAPDAAVLLWGQPTILRGAEARDAFVKRYRAPSAYTWRAAHALASTDGLFGCTLDSRDSRTPPTQLGASTSAPT